MRALGTENSNLKLQVMKWKVRHPHKDLCCCFFQCCLAARTKTSFLYAKSLTVK